MGPKSEAKITQPNRESAGKRKRRTGRKKSKEGRRDSSMFCCSRKKSSAKKMSSKKHRGKMKGTHFGRSKNALKHRGRKSKSKELRKGKSGSRSKIKNRIRSRKDSRKESRKDSRSKSRSKSRSVTASRRRSKTRMKGKPGAHERNLLENRQHLFKSQSLSASQPPSEKSLPKASSIDSSSRRNVEQGAVQTPYSPKNTVKGQKAPQPAVDANPDFQPHRKPDDKNHEKKDGAPPSTAIDIDSSTRQRRPKSTAPQKEMERFEKLDKRSLSDVYSGEFVKGKDNKYQKSRSKPAAPFEPSFGTSEKVADEEIDPNYPAQRLVITNFIRNACRMKRWLYEDSYPLSGARPAINDLFCKKSELPIVRKCWCGRRNLCDRSCEDRSNVKRNTTKSSIESERIRGELQRLEVILRNIDD